ncbi:MAG: rhodanese-like domain-containing protein [Pseudomonadota bacterium]
MKRVYTLLVSVLAVLLVVPTAWSYDIEAAKSYAKMFEPVQGVKAGKALHLIKPDGLVKRVKKGEAIVAIDVRTPAEFGFYGMAMTDTMAIPINELFKPENLERIPSDKLVLIVCKAGTRATAAATALRHIGFDNVYVLKGGLGAMASYLNPKTANMPLSKTK